MAVGDTPEPWESSEVGVDVVMYHLEGARTVAHHGGVYRGNAEAKLQGRTFDDEQSRSLCSCKSSGGLGAADGCNDVCGYKVRPSIPCSPHWFSV